jgi:hypothetical protein
VWGAFGWAMSVIGNHLAAHTHLASELVHVDEIFVGIAIGLMRWFQGEWRLERVYTGHSTELKIRNGLQLMMMHNSPEIRRKAMQDVLSAFEGSRPVHPDFRAHVTAFIDELLAREKDSDPL